MGLLLRKNKSGTRVWWLGYPGRDGCERRCQQIGTSATGSTKHPQIMKETRKEKDCQGNGHWQNQWLCVARQEEGVDKV